MTPHTMTPSERVSAESAPSTAARKKRSREAASSAPSVSARNSASE